MPNSLPSLSPGRVGIKCAVRDAAWAVENHEQDPEASDSFYQDVVHELVAALSDEQLHRLMRDEYSTLATNLQKYLGGEGEQIMARLREQFPEPPLPVYVARQETAVNIAHFLPDAQTDTAAVELAMAELEKQMPLLVENDSTGAELTLAVHPGIVDDASRIATALDKAGASQDVLAIMVYAGRNGFSDVRFSPQGKQLADNELALMREQLPGVSADMEP